MLSLLSGVSSEACGLSDPRQARSDLLTLLSGCSGFCAQGAEGSYVAGGWRGVALEGSILVASEEALQADMTQSDLDTPSM